MDNITIQEYPAGTDFEDKEQFPGMSPQFYEPMPRSKYACPNLVRPQNTVLHNVVLKRAVFPENFDGTNETYREVMTFPRVSPDVPLCLVLERSELLPEYVLEWKTCTAAGPATISMKTGAMGTIPSTGCSIPMAW